MRPRRLSQIFDAAGNTTFALDQQNITGSKGVAQGRRIVRSERLTVVGRLLQPGNQTSDIVEHPAHHSFLTFLVLVFSRMAVPASSPAVRSPKLHPKRSHREMDRTIARRLIRTLHLVEESYTQVQVRPPSRATDGNVAPRSAAARPTAQRLFRE